MTVLGGVRCAFVNFLHLEWWHFTDVRTVTVVASAMLMYIVFLREQFAKNTPDPTESRRHLKTKCGMGGLTSGMPLTHIRNTSSSSSPQF